MKKWIAFSAACTVMLSCSGCTNPYQQEQNAEKIAEKYESHSNVISLSAAAVQSDSEYTVDDLYALIGFLLSSDSEILDSANYDLNADGIWNAEDVTLMKRELLGDAVSDELPIVYMTRSITPEGLMNAYLALGWTLGDNPAVKLSTGEPPASNYLRPELIQDVVQYVNGTIVECNTAYGGSRSSTAMHYQVAEDHGFTAIANVQILDENGSMTLPVNGGSVLSENYVGAAFSDYDSYLILSHFKGHSMAGFGGAIKNISIGLGSSEGKSWIHSGGTKKTGLSGDQDKFLESMAEAGKSVSDYLGDSIVYVNVMNRLSVDCDCSGRPAEPDMHDIGILSSTDPVALDQACIDLVYAADDSASLIKRIESRNGLHTLEHAAEIGLGSRDYQLVILDD